MTKQARLSAVSALLQDGKTHRASDLAEKLGVTQRTIYRDMAYLQSTGLPVRGTPGEGYTATAELTVPPLSLTGEELDALRLGLSVIIDAGDTAQQAAALSLADKLEDALTDGQSSLAASPLPATANLQRHQTQIRQAIAAKQKLRITYDSRTTTLRPLRLDYFGRIWKCIGWDEQFQEFAAIPLVDITMIAVLPGLFVDEPGKTLQDYLISP